MALMIPTASRALADEFTSLEPQEKISSFEVEAVYENETGKVIGARFRHIPSRFVLDVLRIQSLPQGFMWVNSPPPSDHGEPHTLEHLLLGKGNKGRYVASLEDMSLGRSSAYTEQRRTCYHFNTEAGAETYFELFQAKLDALLNPNFSDEEIRREVCNMGVTVNPKDSSLWLEEKGTVYNEMVSSFERPWGNLYRQLAQNIYGVSHPLALTSGGLPAAIREMTPQNLRDFHGATHHLNNMGALVSIGSEVGLDECLTKLSGILNTVEPTAEADKDPARLTERLPEPKPAPYGKIDITHFPNRNPNEPALMVFAWPAERQGLSLEDTYVLDLALTLVASGPTSDLYRKFIDSQTRLMDIGASSVFQWREHELGNPIYLGFSNVDPASCTPETIEKVRQVILADLQEIANYADGSDELAAFNKRAINQLIQDRRDTRTFLNTPPRWGYRGTGSAWIDHLQDLEGAGAFRRNLAETDVYANVEKMLSRKKNIWREYIAQWKLVSSVPYAAAATADPKLIDENESAREKRIQDYVDGLKKQYGVSTDSEAVARYKEDYDKKTAVIAKEAEKISMPSFVNDPPLGNDDLLDFEIDTLAGNAPFVASTFENMTSATVGYVFSLDVTPEKYLMYVPALPTMLRQVGVIKDGQVIDYNDFTELLRQDIQELNVYFDVNSRTERVELALRCAGSDLSETKKAQEWLETMLLHPNLRPDNLPRIRDAVDQTLSSARNRMRGSEESWVNTPVYAYWKQDNPLLLSANCFLTQAHALHRLRWRLKSADGNIDRFRAFVNDIAVYAGDHSRDELNAHLDSLLAKQDSDSSFSALSHDAAEDLQLALSDIPDQSLAQDFEYLANEMTADLAIPAELALKDIAALLQLIRHQDNVRCFMVSNSSDRKAVTPLMKAIIKKLDNSPSKRIDYSNGNTPLVMSRLNERLGNKFAAPPIFVGLVNKNTRAGVQIHTADCADFTETDPDRILSFLSARLYGGGGAHSMFMKTWGAGLAYSNGLRSSPERGRLIYYAERCPDLAQTMQFVVDQLKAAPYDTSLGSYAMAQAFSGMRSGARYEQRGEDMADDIADGLTPEIVSRFRKEVLKLGKQSDFYKTIQDRMERVYGEVLPGYGPSAAESAKHDNAIYYVIGPDKQLDSWESYMKSVEGPGVSLTRIYPRDYWQVAAPIVQ